MTSVNTVTGEILEFDRHAAERRAERIALRLDTIADNYRAVLPMIREAIEKRDDLALGYRSPGDYVSDRFGQSLAGLGIEVRRAVVGELTAAGLSTRAIAPVVGVSNYTVHADQVAVRDLTPHTPEPAEEGEAEAGSGHTSEGEGAPEDINLGSEPSPGTGGATPATPRPPVIGIDGKAYTRPEPKRGIQRDKAETYLNLIEMQAAKAAREIQNLTPDQIRRVRPKADLWTVGLRNSIEALQRLVDSLDPEEHK